MSQHAESARANILVVDDDPSARAALVELLREEGYTVRGAADGFKALGQLDGWRADLVVTDVNMPGMDGLELMRRLRERSDELGVIVMTAHATPEHAVTAMQQGADDYLTKPVQFPELVLVVHRTLANHALARENARLEAELDFAPLVGGPEWIGTSPSSRELLGLVRRVADSDASVLVVGPNGSGKELLAQILHAHSRRAPGPFVAVHCAGVAPDALEREIFGELQAGVRTGGAVAQARGGTLFLDDVGELPSGLQIELLRLLQRTGAATDTAGPDVRIVAATPRDLLDEVRAGRFREDLFYRLDVVTLRTPSLAQRRSDIPALATAFLARHAKASGKRIRGLGDRALRVLLGADWPGNVRELERALAHAVAVCQGPEIEPRDLPREIMGHGRPSDEMPPIPGTSLAELERFAILKTLEQVRGSTGKAAEILGISPRKIQYRLAEYRGEGQAPAARRTA